MKILRFGLFWIFLQIDPGKSFLTMDPKLDIIEHAEVRGSTYCQSMLNPATSDRTPGAVAGVALGHVGLSVIIWLIINIRSNTMVAKLYLNLWLLLKF